MQTAAELRPKLPPRPEFDETGPRPELPRGNSTLARLQLLWAARDKLKRAATVGVVAGTLLAFLLPVKYESTAQLMPPDSPSGAGMAMLAELSAKTGGALEGVSSDLLGLKSSGALFIGILNSRTVQERLVRKFDLRKVYRRRLEEDARRDLAENTKIWEDRHSAIISINVTDHERQRAAALAQAYVDELNRLVAELSTSAAHRERIFLEQRLVAVKQNLDQASQQFSRFASENTAVDVKEQGRAIIEVAATLTGQLIAAQSELSGLEQIYNPNNFRVRAVQARIAELQKKLGELDGNQTGEKSPREQPEGLSYPSLRKLPLLGVTYADLYRETKIQESVYETLTAEYEMAKVQEAKEMPSVKVLDLPSVAERRSFPPRLQIIFLSICVAVCLRTLALFARAHWDAIDTRDERKLFAREILRGLKARVPRAPNGSQLHTAAQRMWMRFERRALSREGNGTNVPGSSRPMSSDVGGDEIRYGA